MEQSPPDTSQKAFQLNLDTSIYGTLAEIGAGQEVARWFFRVGGASGSIAKTMSAYDMQFSDAIYGSAKRYVSRERLTTMLDREYQLLIERLDKTRGAESRFFVFANTVAAKSFQRQSDAHGWMGVRFQHETRSEPSEVIIHTRMLDPENLQQQDALGIVGVNLIYAATKLFDQPDDLVRSLLDNLTQTRIEIDMIKLSGPAFRGIDNRLMALKLVEFELTSAAMFTANGEVVQPAEVLYKRPVLVERGAFRPPSRVHLDMLQCAQAQFIQEPQNESEEPLVLFEMNMKQLVGSVGVDSRDFLDRADILAYLGHPILISNYYRYYRLASYLFRYTNKMVGLVMGLPNLQELFEEKYYTDLSGGILESFGRMFKNDLKVYVYPTRHGKTGSTITAENLRVADHLRHLYRHLAENHRIESLRGFDERCLDMDHHLTLESIQKGDNAWEDLVPPHIASEIKKRGAFGYGSAKSDPEPASLE